jgi:2-oxoglutarate decarboxylase
MKHTPLSADTLETLVDMFGSNTAFVQDLLSQYEDDPSSVKESWQQFFTSVLNGTLTRTTPLPGEDESGHSNGNGNGKPAAVAAPQAVVVQPAARPVKPIQVGEGERLAPLSGVAAKIVENMEASLAVPTATSVRTIPVKLLEENRRIINQHLALTTKQKLSFTHLIAWAMTLGLKKFTSLNASYGLNNGQPTKIVKDRINLGLAVDMTKKDGSRSLIVPNIKQVEEMNFAQFVAAYDVLIAKARKNQIEPTDFQGTTVTLTNPGTVGTVSSTPRLLQGQGAIIATGAIDYSAEYQAMAPQTLSMLGVSKVMTMTSTYDHRIIQGAESGQFLAYVHKLLLGDEDFYEQIFADLKIPYKPLHWSVDFNPPLIGNGTDAHEQTAKQMRVLQLINAYRVRGHLVANLDPLDGRKIGHYPELDMEYHRLTIWDLDREFMTGNFGAKPMMTLREIMESLREVYCDKIGIEYMNIQNIAEKSWIQEQVESPSMKTPLNLFTKKRILEKLTQAESFERFLHTKFLGQKRFSIEGGETAIAILDELIESLAKTSAKEVVIGMPHRGRLNVLTHTVGKSYTKIFTEFEARYVPDSIYGSGDVKYHLGAVGTHRAENGKDLTVAVAANPSHLEAVDPVVEGIVRAKQDRNRDLHHDQIVPILMHGDAAFAGQGVVPETLNLSQLKGYKTGGTIHLIVNNQIGFTTSPDDARSTPYCTDVAKMVQAPIFHVNGDDPEACIRVARLAVEYRNKFKKDVVIDMFCYRLHGHNEGDEPAYTSPILYKKVRVHPSVREIYAAALVQEKTLTQAEADAVLAQIKESLNAAFDESKKVGDKFTPDLPLAVPQRSVAANESANSTATSLDELHAVAKQLVALPQGFNLNKKLSGIIQKRAAFSTDNADAVQIDWGLGEALAFGTLLYDGTPVRLAGQDSTRGTFSHRHAAFYDTETGLKFTPLRDMNPHVAPFTVFDSSLSEEAVLGFEYGYSVADPQTLVMWEAQFGDFANGAQSIIDQFIVGAELKWHQPSSLVLLLPHGYEGQGPEHSSARIERFLQLCAERNLRVVNCTTPAQYFHAVRRQIKSNERKPLVVFTPKSLLRHPMAVSVTSDLTSKNFQEVMDDVQPLQAESVTRVVFTSGKVYYDLLKERNAQKKTNIAILRIEQYYPYPTLVKEMLKKYSAATEVFWVQEEPRNMGVWGFIHEYLQADLQSVPTKSGGERRLKCVSRPAAANPATGSLQVHEQQQAALVAEALA